MLAPTVYSQIELVPVNHKVYTFLNSLHKRGIIIGYNNANLPFSREIVAEYIQIINAHRNWLSSTEENLLNDLAIEFSYDLNHNLSNSHSLLISTDEILYPGSSPQKYLYAFTDSAATLFVDGLLWGSQRNYGMSEYKSNLSLGEYGFRIRGTVYQDIGFYLKLSSGQAFAGGRDTRVIATNYDPRLRKTYKFLDEKYFENFEGYLRYRLKPGAYLTFGREGVTLGTGYLDKLLISNNAAPFDYGKFDLGYKAVNYSFLYGNLRGDSMGVQIDSKNIIAHRLDLTLSDYFKIGIYEAVVNSNQHLNFTYLNPVSFLFSADLSTEKDNNSNSMIGLDVEIIPYRNTGVQFSFLIDDFDFRYIDSNEPQSNNNKFAWQLGVFNSQPFLIKDLDISAEYTRLDPFVYSHKSNKSHFTHWNYSLGHSLPPNSDEIACKIDYNFSARLRSNIKFRYQRSGEGITYDGLGNIQKNFGSDIWNSDGIYLKKVKFLEGNRVNRQIIAMNLIWEPVRQFFVDLNYSGIFTDFIGSGKTSADHLFFITLSIDY